MVFSFGKKATQQQHKQTGKSWAMFWVRVYQHSNAKINNSLRPNKRILCFGQRSEKKSRYGRDWVFFYEYYSVEFWWIQILLYDILHVLTGGSVTLLSLITEEKLGCYVHRPASFATFDVTSNIRALWWTITTWLDNDDLLIGCDWRDISDVIFFCPGFRKHDGYISDIRSVLSGDIHLTGKLSDTLLWTAKREIICIQITLYVMFMCLLKIYNGFSIHVPTCT